MRSNSKAGFKLSWLMAAQEPASLRIARVSTRPAVGGAAAHLALLEKHLGEPQFQTLFLSGRAERGEGDYYQLRARGERRPQLVPSLRREPSFGHDLHALRDLVRRFRAFEPHIVDTHLSKAGVLGRLAARITRVPATIHTFHVNIFDGYAWNSPERALFLGLERFCARSTSRLISLSDELGDELLAMGIGSKAQWRTVRLGLELDSFEATPEQRKHEALALRRELNIEPNAPIVGVVARLAPVKGLKFLLDAAPRVLQSVPEVRFVIAGDGPLRARLELQARELGLAKRVHFLGLRADVAALYAAFDCLVLPSLQEGTPVSIIEALAAQTPVVASDVGGVSLLVQHERSGLLVPPRDPNALADAVVRALCFPALANSWAREGQALMRREWSVERLVADHRALYEELLPMEAKRDGFSEKTVRFLNWRLNDPS